MEDYQNPVSATISGIVNLFKKQDKTVLLNDEVRADGKTCLITGANSGLGFAIAVDLAKRGARVIMACRSGIPKAGEKVKKISGSDNVEMMKVDLSDLESIDSLIEELKLRKIKIDILVCNAATVPKKARKAAQGFETMFMVNYLAKFVLLNRIWNEELLNTEIVKPRIIIISSEAHRVPRALDFETLGDFERYPVSKVVAQYGYFKLALTTLAREFSRRVNKTQLRASVHTICPGAVNTNIAREAPKWAHPLLRLVFFIMFLSPTEAAKPVIYLALSKEIEERTDMYMHMVTEKSPDEKALDPLNGKDLWERSNYLLESVNYGRTF